jgi:hypothetical protein
MCGGFSHNTNTPVRYEDYDIYSLEFENYLVATAGRAVGD